MNCIPAGMELFPAADEEQFQFIKRVIDDCDYYLLIIGGRYGSTTDEGISYTEKEFDYAISIGLKVIALIHENPDEIPLGKSEKEPLLRERLEGFRKKVCTDRLVKFWKSADQLPALVTTSLVHITRVSPAVGWVRANKAVSVELLAEMNELRKQNAQLRATAGQFTPPVENLAGLEDKIEVYGTCRFRSYANRETWRATCTWAEIFGWVSPYLVRIPNDEFVKLILTEPTYARSAKGGENPVMDDQLFRTIALQLQALGLVSLEYSPDASGGMALFWSITPSGEHLMLKLRTVKKAPEEIGKGEGKK